MQADCTVQPQLSYDLQSSQRLVLLASTPLTLSAQQHFYTVTISVISNLESVITSHYVYYNLEII